ncbi:MAG: hybrid sensor histidine kinase/response regulator [Sulfurimonas sp.]|nr:hybrid sensor histidine kinase/response regulator [Sulfurimonas sp.]
MINNANEKSTILVVDDTPDILSLVMELLKGEYSLKLINNPKKALEFLQTQPNIDLILLDVMMPELDGYELCTIIKADPTYAQTPVIFLTALEKTSDIIRGFEHGAIDYITKPFIPEVLKARIKTHIQLKLLHDNMAKELDEKEKLLCRQSRMSTLGEMFENVTHQWKQPLSIINMSCSALKMSYDFDEEVDRDEVISTIDTVISETDYLSQTIDDFRDFARNDVEKESFDIRDVFVHAVEILSFRFGKTKVEIFNNIESFKYRTYKNYLIQVIINILNNAIDVMEKNSTVKSIKAGLSIKDNVAVLTICDSGGGIKMEDPEAIFEKYATTKEGTEFSGLGLYMCRQIMQNRLNGELHAYNTAEGACFELLLPIVKEE